MEITQAAVLIIATLTVGLMAGVFAIYANAIMPGLSRTDDRTFVGAFQSIDTAIINPLFLTTFLGALVSTGVAAVLQLGEDDRSVLLWILAALVLYLAVFVVTLRIQRTAQRRYQGGWAARSHRRARVREQFDEATWARWNLIRAFATIAAFGCLAVALVLLGRD